MPPNVLSEKFVVITGASSGFGAAAARAFSGAHARVILGARRQDKLASTARDCQASGAAEVLFHPLDVTNSLSVEKFIRWLRERTADVDILLNNAGLALGLEPVAEGNEEDWRIMMETNVLGLLRMTRAVLPMMQNKPGAMIINIGSTAGHTAYEGGAAYCASKAGELQISRALRLELCGTGIRVGTIDPGMAETEFSKVRFKGDEQRAQKVYDGVVPLQADDVAEAVLWVASRPAHVCIDEMIIKATDQAAIHKVHRRHVTPSAS